MVRKKLDLIRFRRKIIHEALGNKCIICGYNKSSHALHLHHVNRHEKDFQISAKFRLGWQRIIEESKKCIMVCANCHAEIHAGLYSKKEIMLLHKKMVYDKDILNKGNRRRTRKEGICKNCKKLFLKSKKKHIYCSYSCSRFARRKVKNRPIKNQLLLELKSSNFVQVGKKYGVTDNAIRKWIGWKNNRKWYWKHKKIKYSTLISKGVVA